MPIAVATEVVPDYKVVGRSVDNLVLNVCNADSNGKPVKQELAADLQAQFSQLQKVWRVEFRLTHEFLHSVQI